MSENKGFFARLKATIEGKKRPSLQKTIENLGMYMLSDEKLKERLEALTALQEEISKPIEATDAFDRVEKLRDRLNMINSTMKQAAVPYGRAGDVGMYAQAMQGWEMLYALSIDILNTCARSIEGVVVEASKVKNEIVKKSMKMPIEELALKLEGFMNMEIYPYGMIIIDTSFYSKDVSPSYATVIQTIGEKRGVQTKADDIGLHMMAMKITELERRLDGKEA